MIYSDIHEKKNNASTYGIFATNKVFKKGIVAAKILFAENSDFFNKSFSFYIGNQDTRDEGVCSFQETAKYIPVRPIPRSQHSE